MNNRAELVFPPQEWVRELVCQSLAEDIGDGDISTALTVTTGMSASGHIVVREEGVVAGLPLIEMVYRELSPQVTVELLEEDGSHARPGQEIAILHGSAATLLTGERTALNFLQHLSGIATLTSRYVAAVAGTPCQILDTRKTLPGYRYLAKYAVQAGGGHNHRLGLHDRILLKDNHWVAAGGTMADHVARARQEYPTLLVQIEVDDLTQFQQILPLGVDWILLDNFSPQEADVAVRTRDATTGASQTRLEASGGINLENVRAYAEAQVDAVSIGRITHSAPALDIGLDLEISPELPGGAQS